MGVLVVSAGVAACTFGNVDLEGKQCPCTDGWVCDAPRNVCVRSVGADAATDAGGDDDAAPIEGGLDDSGWDGAVVIADGGSSDTGAGADTGPIDSGVDAGPAPTECGGALASATFCDGFEDGPTFEAWADSNARDGTLTWVTDTVYRGTGALRAETTASGGFAQLHSPTMPPVTSGDYWLRFYVLIPATSSLSHFDIAALTPARADGTAVYIYTDRLSVWFDETMSAFATDPALPRDRWTCLQVHLVVGNTGGALDIYIDGALQRSAAVTDTLPSTGYEKLYLGITWSPSMQGPTAIYMDEVAVGTAPLPCD